MIYKQKMTKEDKDYNDKCYKEGQSQKLRNLLDSRDMIDKEIIELKNQGVTCINFG